MVQSSMTRSAIPLIVNDPIAQSPGMLYSVVPMFQIHAVCDEDKGCPLYRREARLEFSPPTVSGVDGLPVCAIAVENLQKVIPRLQAGQPASAFAHTYCGGCPAGKSWWTFQPVSQETEASASPAASQFILNSISKMKMFTGVHMAKLMRIARLIKGTRVPAGRPLITRGKHGDAFFIVLEGECEVVQQDDNQVESTLATLPAGECFGEMSLITGEPASATVRAKGDVTVLAVSKENFNQMLGIAPEIAITLARILANRLARTGRWVIDELKKGIIGRLELIPPGELIQAMNVNGQTGMLIVQNADKALQMYLHDGQVHEVKMGEKDGEEAFFEFMGWARGNFRFEPVRREQSVKQVSMDTVGMLLEGMRRVDEFRQTGVWRKPEGGAPPPQA